MSIVTGVDLPGRLPGAAEMARLKWDVRHLTHDQVREVCQAARSYKGAAGQGALRGWRALMLPTGWVFRRTVRVSWASGESVPRLRPAGSN